MTSIAIVLYSVVFSVSVVQGCAVIREDHIISEPTIQETTHWRMVKKCGYEGCGPPPVSVLIGKDISIRIESYSDEDEKLFLIKVEFLDYKRQKFSFNPSLATVELANHAILTAKGFTCSYTIADVNYLRSNPPLAGAISIKNNDCFLLFFDAPPPPVEQEFTFRLNGVTRQGNRFNIPEVVFRKRINRY